MITLKVNVGALNFRAKPNKEDSTKIIGTLPRGTELEFIKASDDFYWVQVKNPAGEKGWVSFKYCLVLPDPKEVRDNDYRWLKIAFGEKHFQIKELKDPMENARILLYLQSCELLDNSMKNDDETAWCSAFMNWCVEKAGYEGTNSAWALNWKNWGQPLETPRRGCVAVFKRFVMKNGEKKTYGHVGFYLGKDGEKNISILGGNQRNRVKISSYPIDSEKYQLVGYRYFPKQ
ncbi:MAG: SH3 domain-containing C40 family peptidase [Bacteroidota bacterium]